MCAAGALLVIECAQIMMPLSLALAHSAVRGACLSVCVSTSQQLNGARDLGFLFHCSCSRCGLHIFQSFYVLATDAAERARFWCAECLKLELQREHSAIYRLAQRRPIRSGDLTLLMRLASTLKAIRLKAIQM